MKPREDAPQRARTQGPRTEGGLSRTRPTRGRSATRIPAGGVGGRCGSWDPIEGGDLRWRFVLPRPRGNDDRLTSPTADDATGPPVKLGPKGRCNGPLGPPLERSRTVRPPNARPSPRGPYFPFVLHQTASFPFLGNLLSKGGLVPLAIFVSASTVWNCTAKHVASTRARPCPTPNTCFTSHVRHWSKRLVAATSQLHRSCTWNAPERPAVPKTRGRKRPAGTCCLAKTSTWPTRNKRVVS